MLEVLVALAVTAIAMTAIIESVTQQTRARGFVQDHAYATWVAANALETLRLEETWPAVGIRRGEARMGHRNWHWWMEIKPTEEPRMRRVDVYVGTDRNERDPVASLSGFFGDPG